MLTIQGQAIPTRPDGLPDPGSCCLCGRAHRFAGVYVPGPKEQAMFRPRPVGRRMIVYGLCGPCSEQPDVLDRVEAKVMSPMSQALAGGVG